MHGKFLNFFVVCFYVNIKTLIYFYFFEFLRSIEMERLKFFLEKKKVEKTKNREKNTTYYFHMQYLLELKHMVTKQLIRRFQLK